MKIRNIGLAAASIAALAPAISNASPEKASLNACASAFASSLAAPGAAVPGVQGGLSRQSIRRLDARVLYAATYTFDLKRQRSEDRAADRARELLDGLARHRRRRWRRCRWMPSAGPTPPEL